jgi:hypothetical protein
MAEGEAGSDCREKQVAEVGEIEAEQNAEENFLEFPESASGYENDAE